MHYIRPYCEGYLGAAVVVPRHDWQPSREGSVGSVCVLIEQRGTSVVKTGCFRAIPWFMAKKRQIRRESGNGWSAGRWYTRVYWACVRIARFVVRGPYLMSRLFAHYPQDPTPSHRLTSIMALRSAETLQVHLRLPSWPASISYVSSIAFPWGRKRGPAQTRHPRRSGHIPTPFVVSTRSISIDARRIPSITSFSYHPRALFECSFQSHKTSNTTQSSRPSPTVNKWKLNRNGSWARL